MTAKDRRRAKVARRENSPGKHETWKCRCGERHLNAVALQPGFGVPASDAVRRLDSVLSRDEQIVLGFDCGRRAPAVEVQQIGQATSVTTSDFSVPEGRY